LTFAKGEKMKKFLSILLVGLLCVCCFALGACKEEPKTDVYKLDSIIFNGETYELGEEFMGQTLTKDLIIFEFKGDGKVVAKQDGKVAEGTMTWTKDGNTYTIVQTVESESMTYTGTLEGDTLTLDLSGSGMMIYVLKKA
jgi:hypothetical protein